MILQRRKFLSLLAAPLVVSACNIMPVKSLPVQDDRKILREEVLTDGTIWRVVQVDFGFDAYQVGIWDKKTGRVHYFKWI